MTVIKRTAFFLCCFFYSIVYAQKPVDAIGLQEKYAEYLSLNREAVYLHLDKTSFLPKEELWFAAYVYNPGNNRPSIFTSNLHVNIYNASGEHLGTKTIFINGGKGTGSFQLKPGEFKPGNYIIKASTRYMDNFSEDLSYATTFTILGGTTGENPLPEKENVDLQILPEGGHLLANTYNNVGVKLLGKTGAGIPFLNAKVKDSENKVVTYFNSNEFGMGKFGFRPEPGKSYSLVINANGENIIQPIGPAEVEGLTLSTHFLKDELIVSVKTNKKSLANLEKENLLLAVHQKGKMKIYQFQFPNNKPTAPVNIKTDSLFPGINTLTIFNEAHQPLAERLVFNNKGVKRLEVEASLAAKPSDSLELTISTNKNGIKGNSLSISVLPAGTRANAPNHDILSAFLLKPYINGHVENAGYYFSKDENKREQEYNLDLLLLTQGWSKYSWKDIFNHPPHERYQAERGFTVEGRINNPEVSEGQTLFLKSNESGLFQILELDAQNRFKAENIFLMDSASIYVGLANKKNKIEKPAINLVIKPFKRLENLEQQLIKKSFAPTKAAKDYEFENFISSSQQLDTVLISGSSKSAKEIAMELDPSGQTEIITDQVAKQSLFFTSYLRMQGFEISTNPGSGELQIISRRLGQNYSPIIYMDNVRVQNYNFLSTLYTEDVESVYINRTGGGIMGATGIGGVIKINTLNDLYREKSDIDDSTTFMTTAENGFAPAKEFYTPRYRSYTSKIFEDYGIIQWIGDLYLNQKGTASIKIQNTLQSEIKLLIQGMTEEGNLISEEININTANLHH
ncbi:hypothetical protein RM553_01375 [Zunongwangia sp. F363]|uniref:TonB-dependent receptor plug domain-containing protein n=1 Tax=Autumnicola tepida TaxID=3075595 RepID=A0ABU3C5Y2_9FLAO|nr:hypothetical protein [Zunongwangia sp. F363]MDT0641470.1 hypothetical protein [Zunongwangia sp. F363]